MGVMSSLAVAEAYECCVVTETMVNVAADIDTAITVTAIVALESLWIEKEEPVERMKDNESRHKATPMFKGLFGSIV